MKKSISTIFLAGGVIFISFVGAKPVFSDLENRDISGVLGSWETDPYETPSGVPVGGQVQEITHTPKRSEAGFDERTDLCYLYAYKIAPYNQVPSSTEISSRPIEAVNFRQEIVGCVSRSGRVTTNILQGCMAVTIVEKRNPKRIHVADFSQSFQNRWPFWCFLGVQGFLTCESGENEPSESNLLWNWENSVLGATVEYNKMFRWNPVPLAQIIIQSPITPDPEGSLVIRCNKLPSGLVESRSNHRNQHRQTDGNGKPGPTERPPYTVVCHDYLYAYEITGLNVKTNIVDFKPDAVGCVMKTGEVTSDLENCMKWLIVQDLAPYGRWNVSSKAADFDFLIEVIMRGDVEGQEPIWCFIEKAQLVCRQNYDTPPPGISLAWDLLAQVLGVKIKSYNFRWSKFDSDPRAAQSPVWPSPMGNLVLKCAKDPVS
ncbi:MAG: hypothetical protein M1829_000089 [Trizodia sp. TS-e1964]|nr:MAG: hypothetical protein M1829_000089 [Trizodia sp. TS-e1964]